MEQNAETTKVLHELSSVCKELQGAIQKSDETNKNMIKLDLGANMEHVACIKVEFGNNKKPGELVDKQTQYDSDMEEDFYFLPQMREKLGNDMETNGEPSNLSLNDSKSDCVEMDYAKMKDLEEKLELLSAAVDESISHKEEERKEIRQLLDDLPTSNRLLELQNTISKLDEGVYKSRVASAQTRMKHATLMQEVERHVYSDPDLPKRMNAWHEKLNIIADTIIAVHRQHLQFDRHFDVDDVKSQVTDLSYLTNVHENVLQPPRLAGGHTPEDKLIDQLHEGLNGLQDLIGSQEHLRPEMIDIYGQLHKVVNQLESGCLSTDDQSYTTVHTMSEYNMSDLLEGPDVDTD